MRLVGRYELRELIGEGAMAEVWRAHDPSIDRVLAIKLLKPALANDPRFRKLFREEAQKAAVKAAASVVPPGVTNPAAGALDGSGMSRADLELAIVAHATYNFGALLILRRTGVDATAEGWSAFAGYYVLPKTLQAVLRFETYDSNVNTADTTSDTWTLGLNYYLKGDDLKLSLNYLLGDPAGALSDQGRLLGRLQVIF